MIQVVDDDGDDQDESDEMVESVVDPFDDPFGEDTNDATISETPSKEYESIVYSGENVQCEINAT